MTFLNSAAEEMLGWTAAELHDRDMHDTIHYARADGSPYAIDECPQRAAYADGVESRVDDEVLWRKDGTSFPVEYIARPLLRGDQLAGSIITFRDTTERKQAEGACVRAASASISCSGLPRWAPGTGTSPRASPRGTRPSSLSTA